MDYKGRPLKCFSLMKLGCSNKAELQVHVCDESMRKSRDVVRCICALFCLDNLTMRAVATACSEILVFSPLAVNVTRNRVLSVVVFSICSYA